MWTFKQSCYNFGEIYGGGKYWTPYIINSNKGTFGKHGSSHFESSHDSVKKCFILNIDGIHSAMQALMKRQKV